MSTVAIHPSQLVIGALQTLGRAGFDATLTADNVRPALSAAAELLRALGAPVAGTATTNVPGSMTGRGVSAMGEHPMALDPPAHSATAHPTLGEPSMWARADMLDALARRDIGAVYQIMRRHGIAQRRIAAATAQSQSEISEITGGRQVVSYDLLTRIADGLGIPRELLGLVGPT